MSYGHSFSVRGDVPPKGWRDRFVDARFNAAETTAWEELVKDGWGHDDATAELIRRRAGDRRWH